MRVDTFAGMALGVEETNVICPESDQRGSPELDGDVRQKLLVEWNDTASPFPRAPCIHELFSEQVSQRPAAVAVVMGEQSITYGELDRRANQLAHHLRNIGVGPEEVVGLGVERSLEMVVALLGILKAGGAYLPLDKNYPLERIAYLLKDAGACAVVTSAESDSVFASCGVPTVRLALDAAIIVNQPNSAPVSDAISGNLVYVMYTSGSSGNPKGVGVVHYNVSRLVRNTNYVQITANDVFLQSAPVTFDAATFEIWGALLNGAKLVLYPPEPLLDLSNLKSVIHKNGVSVLWLTSGLFNSIVDADLFTFTPVKQLLVGGDTVSATHVRRLRNGIGTCSVINGYGPTEGTTFSVCFPIADFSDIRTTVPIGRPVSNTTVYVLDSNMELAPPGTTGELYIGGAGLARGYFHQADLTAESFVPNPFSDFGSRLYRSGDVVRYSTDGVLHFVGRGDFQVKVRGYRIELEEVEAALLSDSRIGQAVVLAQPDPRGDKRLVAYIVSAGDLEPDFRSIREHLSRRLPEYMVPSVFVVLDSLPLTANGKVDRRALPSAEKKPTCVPSLSGLEQTVAEIWSSALGENHVGVDDDFFELGGTSLALINVVVEMGKRFAIPLDTGIVARGATVRALAEAVKEKMGAVNQQFPSIEQAILEIWSSALGENQIGEDDDFFELGGTSLALINVVVEMGKRFAIPLDPGIVARGATVRALTEAVKEKMGAVNQQPPSMEQAILEIWSSALGENQIGEDDDFFELGGTSLALINVVVEMGKRFAIPLDTGIVARGATVRALTEAVKEKMGAVNQQPPSMEQAILEIWSSALGENHIGVDDDFFELGGTSLALINVVVEMGKRFAIPLDTGIVARGATVRALAEAVRKRIEISAETPLECLALQ
jgi:amino acid adenylation domain-containing protein